MPHGRHAMGRRACSTVLDRGPHESGPPSTIASAVREVGPTRLDGRKGTEDRLSAFSILVTVTVSHNHWDHPDNWPGKLAKTVLIWWGQRCSRTRGEPRGQIPRGRMGNAQATADALPSSWYDQADDATKKKASSRLSTRSKPADTMDRSPVQKSMSSMDGRKKRASGDLYDEYLTHPIPKEDGSAEVSATLDRVALKRMLSEVSDEHFDVLWRLFDASGSGLVKKDQFVVAMVRRPSVLAASNRL